MTVHGHAEPTLHWRAWPWSTYMERSRCVKPSLYGGAQTCLASHTCRTQRAKPTMYGRTLLWRGYGHNKPAMCQADHAWRAQRANLVLHEGIHKWLYTTPQYYMGIRRPPLLPMRQYSKAFDGHFQLCQWRFINKLLSFWVPHRWSLLQTELKNTQQWARLLSTKKTATPFGAHKVTVYPSWWLRNEMPGPENNDLQLRPSWNFIYRHLICLKLITKYKQLNIYIYFSQKAQMRGHFIGEMHNGYAMCFSHRSDI